MLVKQNLTLYLCEDLFLNAHNNCTVSTYFPNFLFALISIFKCFLSANDSSVDNFFPTFFFIQELYNYCNSFLHLFFLSVNLMIVHAIDFT